MTATHPDFGAKVNGGEAAHLATRHEKDCLVVALSGHWTTDAVAAHDAALRALGAEGASRARIDLGGLKALDTIGAWLVHRTAKQLQVRGLRVEFAGAEAPQMALIETVRANDVAPPTAPFQENFFLATLAHIGRASCGLAAEARDLVSFLGQTIVVFLRSLLHPGRLRLTPLVNHMEKAGLDAMPIVGLISFLIGVVLAYQGADQLARFGAQIFTVNLVGIGVLREMAIILTAIIVAGRSGSAYTAQIGTMMVREEVDAMRTIGLDPIEILVMPRVFALVLVMPLLTFYADIMGLIGGAVMTSVVLDISFETFARQLRDAVPMWSFWVGIIKAPIFGFVIGLVGCFEGFKVERSAESVGLRTTAAVVAAVFIVIVLDAIFSILFSIIGI